MDKVKGLMASFVLSIWCVINAPLFELKKEKGTVGYSIMPFFGQFGRKETIVFAWLVVHKNGSANGLLQVRRP